MQRIPSTRQAVIDNTTTPTKLFNSAESAGRAAVYIRVLSGSAAVCVRTVPKGTASPPSGAGAITLSNADEVWYALEQGTIDFSDYTNDIYIVGDGGAAYSCVVSEVVPSGRY